MYFHGVTAATHFFSIKLKIALNETAVQSIRDSYRSHVSIRVKLGESSVLSNLPERKHGRPKLIGNDIDEQVLYS